MAINIEQQQPNLDVFDRDEVRDVLRKTFYSASDEPIERRRRKTSQTLNDKPEHYEVICISMYREDLKRLDEKVASLKADGHRKMSRSALIRYALDTADLSHLPRGY